MWNAQLQSRKNDNWSTYNKIYLTHKQLETHDLLILMPWYQHLVINIHIADKTFIVSTDFMPKYYFYD